jgi:hypothetical protein
VGKRHSETHAAVLNGLGALFWERPGLNSSTSHDVICPLLATDPEARVRFPKLPEFQRSSGSGMGSTQPREYN